MPSLGFGDFRAIQIGVVIEMVNRKGGKDRMFVVFWKGRYKKGSSPHFIKAKNYYEARKKYTKMYNVDMEDTGATIKLSDWR